MQGSRKYQQDRIYSDGGIHIVCDGMGGHPNGDLAAEGAISTFINEYNSGAEDIEVELKRVLEEANKVCMAHGDRRGSTFTGFIDTGDIPYVVHCGDSRIYHISDDEIAQITTDHADARTGGILSCIGFLDAIQIEPCEVQSNDRIVIVSDGVSGVLSDDLIKLVVNGSIIRQLNPAENLIVKALVDESRDNCTALVLIIT